MTGRSDIFNPAAHDHIANAGKMVPDPRQAQRPGSGVMSEAQWQAWMREVDKRMREINERNLAKRAAGKQAKP